MPTTTPSEIRDGALRAGRETDRSATNPGERGQRRRILLKLSGEVFGGGRVGVDTAVVRNIAEATTAVARGDVPVVRLNSLLLKDQVSAMLARRGAERPRQVPVSAPHRAAGADPHAAQV